MDTGKEEDQVKKLEKMISEGEGEQQDFKQSISSLPGIARTLAAFANTTGGRLLVGVKDDRTLASVDPEEEMYMINEAAETWCDPPVKVHYEVIEYDPEDKSILVALIPESENKPHKSMRKSGEWQTYIRQNDKTLPAGKKAEWLLEQGISKGSGIARPETPNQRRLVAYLEKNERITLKQFSKLVNISERRARRELEEALKTGLIRVLEHEQETLYAL
ncbi:helix-turn-helix domain-containing protein [Roseivirga sp. BDSF3-8]|uniref:AlbA family DNA-binding domain-containing protein n=1 Tax=Roseivirga sp. BDSF3-8 TaxID=3241598 RepID=UPI0035318C96